MLATIRDDTWNVLNLQQNPQIKKSNGYFRQRNSNYSKILQRQTMESEWQKWEGGLRHHLFE